MMRFKCILVFFILFEFAAMIIPKGILATTIVCIRTKDVIVMAADSKRIHKNIDKHVSETSLACKLFCVNNRGFALSGLTGDNKGVNLHARIAEILRKEISIPKSIDVIQESFKPILKYHCEKLKKKDHVYYYSEVIERKKGILCNVVIASFDKGKPILSGINFTLKEDVMGLVNIYSSAEACPTSDPWCITTMGMTKNIRRYLDREQKEVEKMKPEKAVNFLIQLEIKAGTPSVGPPVDVLMITPNGGRWISRKKNCTESP